MNVLLQAGLDKGQRKNQFGSQIELYVSNWCNSVKAYRLQYNKNVIVGNYEFIDKKFEMLLFEKQSTNLISNQWFYDLIQPGAQVINY